jgi:hypothetical protein
LEADLNMLENFTEIWNGRGRPEITTYTLATVNTGQWYKFRLRQFNLNGASPYSEIYMTFACVLPSKPQTPTWATSNATSISIMWGPPVENGGCRITYYKVYRDSGE